MMKLRSLKLLALLSLSIASGTAQTQTSIDVVEGWNLLGNGSGANITLGNALNDSTAVNTVWTWNASLKKWSFYTPTLSDGGAAYAATKSYEFLSTIFPNQGFWVNAKQAFTVSLTSNGTGTITVGTSTSSTSSTSGTTTTTAAATSSTTSVQTTTTTTLSTAGAIASAKALFAQIRTDLSGLYEDGAGINSLSTGAVNQEAFKFKQSMNAVQVPVDVLLKDSSALLVGIDLYKDYVAQPQRSAETGRSRGSGVMDLVAGDGGVYPAIACTLYQDSDLINVATAPVNANVIFCLSRYYVMGSDQWRHAFKIIPKQDGTFGYAATASSRSSVSGTPTTTFLQPEAGAGWAGAFTGTVAPTLDTNGRITAFSLNGELPAGFQAGSNTLVNYKHVVSETASVTYGLDGGSNFGDVTAIIDSYSDASTREGTLNIKNLKVDASSTDLSKQTASFDFVMNTLTSEFEGIFTIDGLVIDTSGYFKVPVAMSIKGALRNIDNGATTEFLSGELSASVDGYEYYDGNLPQSSSNKFTTNLLFVGALTAPNRPKIELSLNGGADSLGALLPVTLKYQTLVNSKPTSDVTLVATPTTSTTPASFVLAEATSGLSLSWKEGDTSANLVLGDPVTTIGTITKGSNTINYVDGTFESLDFSLN